MAVGSDHFGCLHTTVRSRSATQNPAYMSSCTRNVKAEFAKLEPGLAIDAFSSKRSSTTHGTLTVAQKDDHTNIAILLYS